MVTPCFDDAADVSARLDRDGYCVVRQILPTALLDTALDAFTAHLLPYGGCLARQTGRREVNLVGPSGGLVNALVDIHREDAPQITAFRAAVEAVMRHGAIADVLHHHFGRHCRAVHLIFLDESKNGPHQDHAYEDSVPAGRLLGLFVPLWNALGPADNRFFVVPGSAGHVVPYDSESLHSNSYIRDVYAAIAERHGGRLLPLDLARGDVVLFGATMIHGTIKGESGRLPRIVVHYMPEDATYRAIRLDHPVAVRDHGMPLAGAVT